MRTEYDLEMPLEIGFVMELNYSHQGKPSTSMVPDRFLPDDFLLFIDESHATLPAWRNVSWRQIEKAKTR